MHFTSRMSTVIRRECRTSLSANRGWRAIGQRLAAQLPDEADGGRGGLVITERGQLGGVIEQGSPQVT